VNRKHGNTETDHFRSAFVLKRLFTNKPEPLKPVFNHFAEIKIITMFAFFKNIPSLPPRFRPVPRLYEL